MKGFHYLVELVVDLNVVALIEFFKSQFIFIFWENFGKNENNNLIYAEPEKVLGE
jgi:hypothetical protein